MTAIDIESWVSGTKVPNSVLILLNQPITTPELFDKAWDACEHRVIADGAANRLMALKNSKYVPDFIVGDLDSVESESLKHYEALGVPLISRKSQDATDFMKSMTESHEQFDPPNTRVSRQFFAFGAVGGRLDHTWSSFLCLSIASRAGDRLFLISEQNVTMALTPGKYTISTPRSVYGEACGYAPLDAKCTLSTKGLQWDVTDAEFSFTTHLSTSNYLKADEVQIDTRDTIMFTIEIRSPA